MRGHGLTQVRPGKNKPPGKPTPLAKFRLRRGDSGAFDTISELLGSGQWKKDVPVAAMWAALPAYRRTELHGWSEPPALELGEAHAMPPEGQRWNGKHVWITGIPRAGLGRPPRWEKAIAYLDQHYPSLAGHRDPEAPELQGVVPTDGEWASQAVRLALQFDHPPNGDWPILFSQLARQEGRQWFIMPSLGNSGSPSHPLVTWWAILLALSLRARYEPAEWIGQDLNINANPAAAWLEEALDEAVDLMPSLLLDAMQKLT